MLSIGRDVSKIIFGTKSSMNQAMGLQRKTVRIWQWSMTDNGLFNIKSVGKGLLVIMLHLTQIELTPQIM